DNAIKYTKQGGVDVKIKLEGDKVKIGIKDTGMGMTPEDQKELFKAFHRNKESWAANATGKGIGLFLTDQIIHAHSGKIWAESEGPGKGTTFNVELPINADLQSINKPLQVKSVNTNI
ncbi:MAG: HAMP domain-containing sensor histidine kinase, partial [Candidatus Staskawiczbacteria bacterium]|nr:HAMP domain-containing sensor histidine kinase [Candidatus Staskawiczbacteria bacterium]